MKTIDHPLYVTWTGMKSRCYNSKASNYHLYGGRGITVCKKWRDSFWAFVEDMGPRPEGCTLDRRDNARNYTPSNCRWATRRQQANNTRRCKRQITAFGKTKTATEWAEETGIQRDVLFARIFKLGWDPEKALTKPTNGAVKYTANGETKTITEWSEATGIPKDVLYGRIEKLGWPVEKAVSTKKHEKGQQKDLPIKR